MGGTGIQFETQTGFMRAPRYDPVTSEHLWVLITTYRIANPAAWMDESAGRQSLDSENLLAVTPIMCLHCEQVYTAELAADPCEGNPA